jgi:hypothetical protein
MCFSCLCNSQQCVRKKTTGNFVEGGKQHRRTPGVDLFHAVKHAAGQTRSLKGVSEAEHRRRDLSPCFSTSQGGVQRSEKSVEGLGGLEEYRCVLHTHKFSACIHMLQNP